jgi:hypothetical protein
MREAARAIALDQYNTDAQGILGRLLVSVPRPIPEGARKTLVADDNRATKLVLVRAAWAYVANFALLGVAVVLGIRATWPLALLGVVTLEQAVACYLASRREEPLNAFWTIVLPAGHFLLLMLVGTIAGSLLFLPLFAFGSLPIMLMMPRFNRPLFVLAFHIAAIGIPLVLEITRVIPPSWSTDELGVHIHPWAFEAPPRVLVAFLFCVIFLQMFVITRVFTAQRNSQQRAQEQLHAQRWQLAQLVE